MSRRPTVGDKVRVLPGGLRHGYEIGYVGTITTDFVDWYRQPYILDNATYMPWLEESQVELIEEKEPKMTKLEEARKQYEALGAAIAALEAEEKAKRPELAPGQVWKHCDGDVYIVNVTGTSTHNPLIFLYSLITIQGRDVGRAWCPDMGFSNKADDFIYLGMASEVLTVTDKAK